MNKDLSGWAFGTTMLVTVVLFVAGAVMVQDPPSPADAAVGKGLLVLGCCAALVALAVLAYAINTAPRQPEAPRVHGDRDDA